MTWADDAKPSMATLAPRKVRRRNSEKIHHRPRLDPLGRDEQRERDNRGSSFNKVGRLDQPATLPSMSVVTIGQRPRGGLFSGRTVTEALICCSSWRYYFLR